MASSLRDGHTVSEDGEVDGDAAPEVAAGETSGVGARVDSGTPAPAQPARATETRAIIPKWRQAFGPGVLAFTRITYIEIR